MRFIARMATTDDLYINVEADKMIENEGTITAYRREKLIAIVDKSALIAAYMNGNERNE